MPDTTVVMPNQPGPSLKEKLTAGLKPGCPRCGSMQPWGAASWCPDCGFYPGLSPDDGSASEPQAQAAKEADQNLSVWQRIPKWAYVLFAGEIFLFVESLAIRLITEDGSFERSLWSVLQCGLGILAFVSMQVMAFAKGVMKENLTPMDMLARPLAIWEPTLRKLPKGAWKVWLAIWGLSAAILSVAIIGGLRYSVLFEDWGFRQRAKASLMQKLTEAAKNATEKGADNLNEAIEDFAGEAEKHVPNPDDLKKKAAKTKKLVECVVIGYQTSGNSKEAEPTILLLAAPQGNRLGYVGSLKLASLPEKQRAEIIERLPKLQRDKPYVRCKLVAQWVNPVLAFKVKFDDWTESKQLLNPVFEEQLADIPFKKK